MTFELTRWIGMAAEIERRLQDSGGELDESIELMLGHVDLSLPGAVDNAKLFLERLDTVSKEWRERSRKISAVAKGLEQAELRAKTSIKAAMRLAGITEVRGDQYRLVLAKAADKLVIEESMIPPEYTTPVVEIRIDKELVRKALEKGEEVHGARLEENYSLRGYFQKR